LKHRCLNTHFILSLDIFTQEIVIKTIN